MMLRAGMMSFTNWYSNVYDFWAMASLQTTG